MTPPPLLPKPDDFKKAIQVGQNHVRVTICAGSPWVLPLHLSDGGPVDVHINPNPGAAGTSPIVTGHEHGNGIQLRPGTTPGTRRIEADVTARDGSVSFHVVVDVKVINCSLYNIRNVKGAKVDGVKIELGGNTETQRRRKGPSKVAV